MPEKSSVQVWDIPVRVFHWSLVILFVIAYFTGDEENNVHIYCGYAVLALVLFRIVWGFIGTQYARFSDFIYSPREVFQYLKGLVKRNAKYYIGHNPAGGWMVVTLLICLLVVTISGLKVYAIEEGRGPLAEGNHSFFISDAVSEDEEDEDENHEKSENGEEQENFWEEIHEISSDITVLLVLVHVLGVLVSGKLHNENLVKGMITGKKDQIQV